jgi:hypothetical protein
VLTESQAAPRMLSLSLIREHHASETRIELDA